MKKILISLLAICGWAAASFASGAKDYSKYYQNLPVQMQQPTLPAIPDNQVSILEFGGNGNGQAMNTQAFSKAISKLSKMGGGHLNVPAGIYLTGLISLKDNIDLHLEKNAIIVFSEDKNDLIKIDDETGQKEDRATPAINASKRKNISITGEGTIDGNGEWWRPVKRVKVSDWEWNRFQQMGGTLNEKGDIWYPLNLKHTPNVVDNIDAQEKVRNHMIRFTDCENVLVQGVTLLNSPRFHLIPTRCKNVIIDGITVKCPWNAQNGDAIDISSCKDVLIVNNIVDDIDTIDIAHYGKILERDEAFPQRCNIEFAQITDTDIIRTRVWERGSGITMACGTGACATAVAAALTKRAGRKSSIVMDGGTLEIEYSEADDHVYMTGPAAFVFEGEIEAL